MKNFQRNYFTKFEKTLWASSVCAILVSFFLYDRSNYLTLFSSLSGVTALIFIAKGNPIGQVLMIIFGLIYGFISWGYAYYGEMITYIGMSVPMAVISLIAWLKNPYRGNKAEVRISKLRVWDGIWIPLAAVAVTVIFYFVLKHFHTTNLAISTLSISTSFIAVSLSFRRSPYYALAYCVNDLVLIVMWILATKENTGYISVVVCFVVFLVNDSYGFFNWRRIKKRQEEE